MTPKSQEKIVKTCSYDSSGVSCLLDVDLCSCGSCSICSCLARRWTRVDLICSFLPKLVESFLLENFDIFLFMEKKLLPYNK
jgi:hypothetical protein